MSLFDNMKHFFSSDGDYEEMEYTEEEQPVDYAPADEDDDEDGFDDYSDNSQAASDGPSSNFGSNFTNAWKNRQADSKGTSFRGAQTASRQSYRRPEPRPAPVFTPAHDDDSSNVSIVLDYPVSVKDSIENLTKKVMSGSVVLFSLENCPDPLDKRKIELFTAGVVFAIKGHFFKLREDFYIVIPNGVNLDGNENIVEILKAEGFNFN